MRNFIPKKFHWMDLCIKCDKGGKLLVCHQNNCPIIVHQDCLGGCAPKFDEIGNFCCPYCVYKQAIQEFGEAERKAVVAEKALSKYLDQERAGKESFDRVNVDHQIVQLDEHQQERTAPECSLRDEECFMKDTGADVSIQAQKRVGESRGLNDNYIKVVEKQYELDHVVGRCGDESCIGEGKVDQHQVEDERIRQQQSGDEVEGDAHRTEIVIEHHQDAKHLEAHDIREENVEANNETEGWRDDEGQNQEQGKKCTENIKSAPQVHLEGNREGGNAAASNCVDSKPISEKTTRVQSPRVHNLRRSSREKSYVHVNNSSTSCKSPKVAKPSKKFTVSPILKEKRKRLAWKEEEVEMLKKGVQRFSQTVNKNLPWQKILEEGRDVFDETRTPSDLKDKWRNILSKEPLFECS